MKLPRHLAVIAIAALNVFATQPGAAQDGPIRQRIQQRQAQKAAPSADQEAATRITRPGGHSFRIQHDGVERLYRVHVPASYNPARPTPVLFALHGGGGNMDIQANDAYYGLVTKSEREGFVAVFPNGYSRFEGGRFATWNAGNCCGSARDKSVDDVGFIRNVFERLMLQINVDRNRVYATGMSNGGMMSYRLACELPDVFKAIAAVAGTDGTRGCGAGQPVPVLHIHAMDDTHVLFTGGAGPDALVNVAFTSVPDTVAKWVRHNSCQPTPQRVLEKPGAYCEAYSGCRANAQVQLCVTETGGHSWPGGTKPRGGSAASQALSANDVMWDFFSRH